ncbi:DEAD/DEAH box helicase [candidate division KSB1 bacterium]
MNIEQLLDQLAADDEFKNRLTTWRTIEPSPGVFDDLPDDIHPALAGALKNRRINSLYSHQATAYQTVRAGRHTTVVTPTASGKTLCYNLPVLQTILEEPETRALYLFPTKALSQDQVDELHGLITELGVDIKTYTFDGDTPAPARKAIRSSGHIVVTNPDMLHTGILPHHTRWVKLFENLKFVVIDEVHHYRGVFGSHLANVVRRLNRICRFYGSEPVFITCSATIANPGELSGSIIGQETVLIDKSGAPTGKRHLLLYNPPVVNKELGIRRGVVQEVRRVAARFLASGAQTIVFARSRLMVEVITTYLKDYFKRSKQSPDSIRGYRGGYLPRQRREIERGLRSGEIKGVVSTSALELGIDIGGLDVSIMAGYPGSVASFWQQAGRAGRTLRTSCSVLVASSSPLDQYMIGNPDYFFGLNPEQGIIDPDNLVILMSHVKCAAFELPFRDGEAFGTDALQQVLHYLAEHKVVLHSDGQWHWTSDTYPAEEVSLRSASPENFVVVDTTRDNRVIGEVDLHSTPLLIHEDAIYIHQGRQYFINSLDWDGRRAYAEEVDVDYYTDAETKTNISVLDITESEPNLSGAKGYGEVSVTTVAVMFKKIKFYTHENVGAGRINLPELTMHTLSFWREFDLESLAAAGIEDSQIGGGLRALANLLVNVAPVYILSDFFDLRAVPMVRAPFSGRPTVYLYDNYPGGVGYSERLFRIYPDLLKASRELLAACPCTSGCPSCVGPLLEIGETGKQVARRLIDLELGG